MVKEEGNRERRAGLVLRVNIDVCRIRGGFDQRKIIRKKKENENDVMQRFNAIVENGRGHDLFCIVQNGGKGTGEITMRGGGGKERHGSFPSLRASFRLDLKGKVQQFFFATIPALSRKKRLGGKRRRKSKLDSHRSLAVPGGRIRPFVSSKEGGKGREKRRG